MTALNEVRVFFRIADSDTHGVVPAIGNGNQMRVDGRPHCCNEAGQRITKIFVLAAPEAVPLHYDTAAEDVVFHVQARQCLAFLRKERIASITALPCASRSCDTRSQSSVVTFAAALFAESIDLMFFVAGFMLSSSRNVARVIFGTLRQMKPTLELNPTAGTLRFNRAGKSCTGACQLVEPVWGRRRKGSARDRPWRRSGSSVGNKFLFPCDPKLRYRECLLYDRAPQNLRFAVVAVCAARRLHIHRCVRPTRPRDGTGHIWAPDCCALHCRQPSRRVPSRLWRLVLDS